MELQLNDNDKKSNVVNYLNTKDENYFLNNYSFEICKYYISIN